MIWIPLYEVNRYRIRYRTVLLISLKFWYLWHFLAHDEWINSYIHTFNSGKWSFFNIERTLTWLTIFVLLQNLKLNSFLTHLCVPKKPNNILNIVREWYSAYKDIGVINLKTSLSSKFNIQCYFVVFYGSKKKRFKPISFYFIFFREEIDMYCTCQLFVTFLFYRLI